MKRCIWVGVAVFCALVNQRAHGIKGATSKIKSVTIPTFPGGGIGPSIVDASGRILGKAAELHGIKTTFPAYELHGHELDPQSYDKFNALIEKITGRKLPKSELEASTKFISIDALKDIVADIQKNGAAIGQKGPTITKVAGGRSDAGWSRYIFDTYFNVRPLINLLPGETPVDLNVYRHLRGDIYEAHEWEDTSTGTLYRQQSMSRNDIRRLFDGVFRYILNAGRAGKGNVVFAHKATISKTMDKAFAEEFDKVSQGYLDNLKIMPALPKGDSAPPLIDNISQQVVHTPQRFSDVITQNERGDILTDTMWKSLGLAHGINVGDKFGLSESGHGAALDIAGKNKANPTAMVLSLALGFDYLGLSDVANLVRSSVRETLKDLKNRTGDLGGTNTTTGFTDAVIRNLNKETKLHAKSL